MNITVTPCLRRDIEPWLLRKHYARRLCPVSHAYGAYRNGVLIGVVTYGVPMSPPLRTGVCGDEMASRVLELNRLCCESEKNLASVLVGRSLRMLPRPTIVVSYADIEQGHVGYVYQACNFIYTGLSAKRTDWSLRGQEHLHGGTVADLSFGQDDRVGYMRETYGDSFYLRERSRKHRYVYFVGSRRERAAMSAALRYAQEPYPKGVTARYDASASVESQMTLF